MRFSAVETIHTADDQPAMPAAAAGAFGTRNDRICPGSGSRSYRREEDKR